MHALGQVQIESWALHSLWDALAKFSKTLEDFCLPTPSVAFDRLETNRLLEVKREYNVEGLQAEVVMAVESLNDGQCAAYNGVIDAYCRNPSLGLRPRQGVARCEPRSRRGSHIT